MTDWNDALIRVFREDAAYKMRNGILPDEGELVAYDNAFLVALIAEAQSVIEMRK